MKNSNKVLIIVNWIPPYHHELVNILAAPKFATCRFRYQSKYVPTLKDVSNLKNKDGTIVIRDRGTGYFLPARTFNIWSAQWVGDVLHLKIKLEDIAALSSNSKSLEEQIENFNSLVSNEIESYSNDPDYDLKKLVFLESGAVSKELKSWKNDTDEDELSHWGNCISRVNDQFEIENIDFFKVINLKNAENEVVDFQAASSENFGFPVYRGESYRLNIIQRTYTGKKGDSSLSEKRFFELSSPSEKVKIPRNLKPILGKYDIFNFSLKVENDVEESVVQSFLSISSSEGELYIPSLEIPLLIRYSWQSILLNSLGIFSFLLFLFFYIWPNCAPSWVSVAQTEKLSTIGMIVTSSFIGLLSKDMISDIVEKIGS